MRAAAIAALAGLGLAGCAMQETSPEPVSVFSLSRGDCFSTDAEHTAAFVTPCSEPHLFEVTDVHPVEGDAFPGDEALQALTDELCPAAFADYTGGAPAASDSWAAMGFAPGEAGWDEQDDREIVCVVTPGDGAETSDSAQGVPSDYPTPEGTP
ncbi:hypothetical protein FM112_05250 [Gulosibacter sp. 10]|nr:hypothetical protein FM112_05250 [Gulosibacter sp. 10]